MKFFFHIFFTLALTLFLNSNILSQSNNPAPYCTVSYGSPPCNQPGVSNSPTNFINDFINSFNTTGASVNIVNNNSGCNGLANNYIYYGCSQYLAVNPGQTITCNMQSGISYNQGFTIFIDWNQDNVFNLPAEQVAGTSNAPTPPGTWTVLSFVVPSSQATGTYRMRVRCAYAIGGTAISPCGIASTLSSSYGETEDYNIYVGFIPSGIITATPGIASSTICAGQSANFNVSYSGATVTPTFTWVGPASYSSTLQNPVIFNTTANMSGTYSVTASNGACPVTNTINLTVVNYPSFTVSPSLYTICQGGSFNATASLTTNSSLYSYQWATTAPGLIFNPNLQSTFIQPGLLPTNVTQANYIYSITLSPTLNPACSVTHTLNLTINNPLTPTIYPAPSLCDIFAPVQLTAVPGGGTWSANPGVSPTGIFTPSLANIANTNTVSYAVSAGTCIVSNTGTVLVSRFYSSALSSSLTTVCVQDPVINLMNIVQNTLTGSWVSNSPSVPSGNTFNSAGLATGNYTMTYRTHSLPDVLACLDSTRLVIPVFNPPTPTISSIPQKCNTSGTVILNASPPGGVWTGNSGISFSGIQTPSLNTIGTNTVIYTAGLGTCVASSSKTFQVSQFNTAALSGTVPNLCTNSTPFNLMSIVQNTNGSWSGMNVNTQNIFNPGLLPTNTYSLVYTTTSTPNPGLCPDTRTIVASVLNPPTPIISQAGPFCTVNAPVQLTVSPATGYWVSSSYLTSGGIFTPSLCAAGNNPVQYVIGTSTCNSSQSGNISIEAFVPATILSGIPDQCNSNPAISLSPITANGNGFWTGSGIVGSSFDPGISGAGNFILQHHTASSPSALCPDQATIAVQVYSLAAPSITGIGPFCNNAAPVQLQVSPVGGIFESGISSAVSPSGLFSPASALIGDNFISYSIAVGPCQAHAQTKISIEKFISASFGENITTVYCKNNLPFNLNSFVQNTGGIWSSSAPIIGSMFDPAKANIGINTFTYQTYSSPSTLLCPDVNTLQIVVKDVPRVLAESNIYSGCAPLEVVLRTPSANSGKGTWYISDGSEPIPDLKASHIFTTPGTYTVVFNYTDDEVSGCIAQVVLYPAITVSASPKADFAIYPEEISISDPVASITNLSSSLRDNYYEWTIPGVAPVTGLHPGITFPAIGKYKITLTATSQQGCKSEVSKIVEVKNDFTVFIPNSFTPNYDGLNDVFMPVFSLYGLDTRTYQMEIFDRWGHELFTSKDYTKGWDGTLQNKGDQVLKEGTYVFKIKYKDLEGRVYEKTGYLSLLPH